jgi:hypothetical protein
MDVDQTVRGYGELTVVEKKRDAAADPVVVESSKPADAKGSTTQETSTLSKAISDAGRSTRRVSLTLAVIILVIVATLTLSLLLRRPSHVGDGLSRLAERSTSAV